MHESNREQDFVLSPEEQQLLTNLDTLGHLNASTSETTIRTVETPTVKNIANLEEQIAYTVAIAEQIIDDVTSREIEDSQKITMLAQIFTVSRKNRAEHLFGKVGSLHPDYTLDAMQEMAESLEFEEENGFIVDDDARMYTFSELLTNQFSIELNSDIQQYVDLHKDKIRYKTIVAYEKNKQVLLASGVGAFIGVLAARAIFKR